MGEKVPPPERMVFKLVVTDETGRAVSTHDIALCDHTMNVIGLFGPGSNEALACTRTEVETAFHHVVSDLKEEAWNALTGDGS